MKGIKRTEETKQKLSQSKTGKKRSEESRRKQSESSKGHKKPIWFGKKVSENFKGVKKTKEHRQKIREANLGKKHSEETKQKCRDSSQHLVPCKWADQRSTEILAVSKDDPRYISGELIYMHSNETPHNVGKVRATLVSTNKKCFLSKDDEKLKTGEAVLGWI